MELEDLGLVQLEQSGECRYPQRAHSVSLDGVKIIREAPHFRRFWEPFEAFSVGHVVGWSDCEGVAFEGEQCSLMIKAATHPKDVEVQTVADDFGGVFLLTEFVLFAERVSPGTHVVGHNKSIR